MRTAETLALDARVQRGPDTYRFDTADGVCSTNSFRRPELCLVEQLWDRDPGHLLVPQANYGVAGIVLAPAAETVTMTDACARRATLCKRNSRENGVDADVECTADPSTVEGPVDTVAYAPRPDAAIPVAKQVIADAMGVLRPGGRCFVAAATHTGVTRYEACLGDLADAVRTVTKSDGWRLLAATRPECLDSPTYVETRQFEATVDGVALPLVTVPGLFSAGHLDDGTRLLAETVSVADGERVLDLCCGYGPLGAYAGLTADCELWLSDTDCRATDCARRSLERAGVDGTVVTGDGVEAVADRRFDHVLCNPPTHAGRGVLADLFDGVERVLAADGRLSVVHHRALELREHLGGIGDVERVETGEEHVVLRAVR